MESVDKQTGQYVGADIDLAQALAKAMGLKGAKIVNNSFNTIQPALFRHKFDVIMSSMSDTPARRKKIAFVDYMRGDEAIVVRKSSSIHANSYAGMCGHTVSVESATTELDGLNAANAHCAKKINIKQYTYDTDAFQALMSGHADAYTGDYVVAAQYVKSHAGVLRLAGKTFSAGGPYGIGLLKSNSALKAALARALAKIRSNGQYAAILKKWNVGKASL
jgi:polar amino acid transport system substrate-binding protein